MEWALAVNAWRHWLYEAHLENKGSYVLVSECQVNRRGYDKIGLKVDSFENVEKVAEAVANAGFTATTAKEMLEEISRVLTYLGIGLGAIGAIALGVASIGVVNTMVMTTYERTREIGVMRACGATRSTVRRLFAFEAAFMGFPGG